MLDLQHPGSDLAGRSEDCKLVARRRGPETLLQMTWPWPKAKKTNLLPFQQQSPEPVAEIMLCRLLFLLPVPVRMSPWQWQPPSQRASFPTALVKRHSTSMKYPLNSTRRNATSVWAIVESFGLRQDATKYVFMSQKRPQSRPPPSKIISSRCSHLKSTCWPRN